MTQRLHPQECLTAPHPVFERGADLAGYTTVQDAEAGLASVASEAPVTSEEASKSHRALERRVAQIEAAKGNMGFTALIGARA